MNSLRAIQLRLNKYVKPNSTTLKKPVNFFLRNDEVYLIFEDTKGSSLVDIAKSDDGYSFQLLTRSLQVISPQNKILSFTNASSFHFKNKEYLLFNNEKDRSKTLTLALFTPRELIKEELATPLNEKGVVVSDFQHKNEYVMYYGSRSIRVGYSRDLKKWEISPKSLLIDANPLEVGNVFVVQDGILLIYYKVEIENGLPYRSAYLALFDKNNPSKLLYKTEKPIWSQKKMWPGSFATPLSSVVINDHLINYWWVNNEVVYAISLLQISELNKYFARKHLSLEKHIANPIIAPKEDSQWQAFTTFNPAAVQAGGKVHILYRAQGYDYVSSVGYANSQDGVMIDERLEQPIYSPTGDFEINMTGTASTKYMSGGGYGGCEDPRVTVIGDRVYMVYVAYDGWSPPRLALTSIHLDDFLNKRWLWSKPVLVSRPGIVDKSGCLLPEKVNGKYVFFHRVFPNILIDFLDDLNFDGKSGWLKGQYQIKIRDNMWDSRKIGVGAPPMRTKDGWLLIYYAVDDRDDSKYCIGAMLLDINDPTKVLHRTDHPILIPDQDYENYGFKAGVAYPCGAVIIKDQLFVYYGGADSVVCVATANLDAFLEELKTKESAHLSKIQVKRVSY